MLGVAIIYETECYAIC